MSMKLKQKNNKENSVLFVNGGFTLIELMTVMAIIAVLASAIMISLGVQRKRAVTNKVLTEMSGAIQNIYLCKSDDGEVESITAGSNICNLGAGYGQWPDLADTGYSYSGDPSSGDSWYIEVAGTDLETICCNSKSGKCGKIDSADACNKSIVIK